MRAKLATPENRITSAQKKDKSKSLHSERDNESINTADELSERIVETQKQGGYYNDAGNTPGAQFSERETDENILKQLDEDFKAGKK